MDYKEQIENTLKYYLTAEERMFLDLPSSPEIVGHDECVEELIKIAERIRIEYAISVLEEIQCNNEIYGTQYWIITNKITELKNKIDGKGF